MTDDLARRAVACRHWRWMDGMLAERPALRMRITVTPFDPPAEWAWLPDLSDPATIGCLLQLVRDAWRDPAAHCRYDRWADWWAVSLCVDGLFIVDGAPTEAAALVAALEAAP